MKLKTKLLNRNNNLEQFTFQFRILEENKIIINKLFKLVSSKNRLINGILLCGSKNSGKTTVLNELQERSKVIASVIKIQNNSTILQKEEFIHYINSKIEELIANERNSVKSVVIVDNIDKIVKQNPYEDSMFPLKELIDKANEAKVLIISTSSSRKITSVLNDLNSRIKTFYQEFI